ncbi:ribosome small subunit-dependent GTPase A [candidate division KSB1 bacterium]|nr:ribosome small subunit-dependent GTPase A [candidate division KSB1 bacterium]
MTIRIYVTIDQKLQALGWSPFFANAKSSESPVGRIGLEHKKSYQVVVPEEVLNAVLAGRLRHQAKSKADLPAVGDWVEYEKKSQDTVRITHILPRKSKLSRKTKGHRIEEQVLATNIDTVFLVSGLDQEFNLRRIERYLALAVDSRADPVILLNKSDLHAEPEEIMQQVKKTIPDFPVFCLSAKTETGFEQLTPYLKFGNTIALIGSSGVGKSLILNVLAGKRVQKVGEVHKPTGEGRHTTTHRQLFSLPGGCMAIDTPGMREIQIWLDEPSVKDAFPDIVDLAQYCKFRNCTHEHEPGCAVYLAVQEGKLDKSRVNSYIKLLNEQKEIEKKQRYRKEH